MNRRWELALFLGLLLAVILGPLASFAQDCGQIRGEVLRLHILANSDSREDQALKLAVRDRLLTEGAELFAPSSTLEEAATAARASLPRLEALARQEIQAQGYDYPVSVTLAPSFFETRQYGEYTLPAGRYLALQVVIGSGEGRNWWCVMYPPLCVPAAADPQSPQLQEIRLLDEAPGCRMGFAVVEWWQRLEEAFRKGGPAGETGEISPSGPPDLLTDGQ